MLQNFFKSGKFKGLFTSKYLYAKKVTKLNDLKDFAKQQNNCLFTQTGNCLIV